MAKHAADYRGRKKKQEQQGVTTSHNQLLLEQHSHQFEGSGIRQGKTLVVANGSRKLVRSSSEKLVQAFKYCVPF